MAEGVVEPMCPAPRTVAHWLIDKRRCGTPGKAGPRAVVYRGSALFSPQLAYLSGRRAPWTVRFARWLTRVVNLSANCGQIGESHR